MIKGDFDKFAIFFANYTILAQLHWLQTLGTLNTRLQTSDELLALQHSVHGRERHRLNAQLFVRHEVAPEVLANRARQPCQNHGRPVFQSSKSQFLVNRTHQHKDSVVVARTLRFQTERVDYSLQLAHHRFRWHQCIILSVVVLRTQVASNLVDHPALLQFFEGPLDFVGSIVELPQSVAILGLGLLARVHMPIRAHAEEHTYPVVEICQQLSAAQRV